jgi:hypothetical protein
MKKLLLSIAVALLLVGPARATLWDYYKGILPSVDERKDEAAQCGIYNYTGTAEQNVAFEKCLRSGIQSGYNPVTGYQSRLTSYISADADSIPVASTKDPAGRQIDLSNISNAAVVKVYLSLEPGTSKEEPIMCTGVTETSWNNCTRGLPFQGGSEVSDSALIRAHNAGAVIVLTNIGQFYNQYIPVNGNANIFDVKNFLSFPTFNTSTQLPVSNGQFATKYYVDQVGAGGFTALNASTTNGIEVYGTAPETFGVAVSSTTGMAKGADGKIYQKTNSLTAIESDNDGIKINSSSLKSLIASVSSSPNTIPLSDASSTIDSWLGIGFGNGSSGNVTISGGTTTLSSDVYYNNLTVSSTGILHTNGYRVFVRGVLENSGSIHNNGNNGGTGTPGSYPGYQVACTVGVGGSGTNSGTLSGSAPGGNGAGGALSYHEQGSSSQVIVATTSIGVAGVTGGTGGAAAEIPGAAGGAIGTLTQDSLSLTFGFGTPNLLGIRNGTTTFVNAYYPVSNSTTIGYFLRSSQASSGGGGGGNDATGSCSGCGGGAGSAGGTMLISARTIINSGIISSKGGNGGRGVDSFSYNAGTGGGGGGGGGSGGALILIYKTLTNSGVVTTTPGIGGTGGNGGAGGQAGGSGNTGNPGVIYYFNIK